MGLDIKNELAALQQRYREDPRSGSFNALIVGESGTGKTHLAKTARGPVFIDMFDPGGEKTLRKEIAEGKVFVDTRWSNEDPFKPTAYAAWKKEFDRRRTEGFFDHFGTYICDSLTKWSDACMNEILRIGGRAGQKPDFTKDYFALKIELHTRIAQMMLLPCDFILTGHLEYSREDADGLGKYILMTIGKGTVTIPLLFDEYWVMSPKESSAGVIYRILTKSTGKYTARSRLAADTKIETYEEANIKKLLEKAGLPYEDKPSPLL